MPFVITRVKHFVSIHSTVSVQEFHDNILLNVSHHKNIIFSGCPWLSRSSGFPCMSCNLRINKTHKIVWTPWSLDFCLPTFYICLYSPEECFSTAVNTLVNVNKLMIMGKTYLTKKLIKSTKKNWSNQETFQSTRKLFFGEVAGGVRGFTPVKI